MTQKAVGYSFDGTIKMGIFTGTKAITIEGSSWTLQGFLNSHYSRIVKVLYFKGATADSDVYHIFYR